MRPKASVTQKQNTIRRKNRMHWSNHKNQITNRRKQQNLVKRLQLKNFNGNKLKDFQVDDEFNYLSINENPNDVDGKDLNDTTSEAEFENEYFADADDNDDCHNSENEYDFYSSEDDLEENLNEEQMKFGNEFLNMQTSNESIRDYDEVVSYNLSKY